jgi:AcrR family transcriptional regulator
MDDLARASGLSKGSLYWHFRSKEDVFLAVFDALAEEIFAATASLAAREGPVLDALRGFGEFAVETIAAQGPMLRAWAEFFAHPEARPRFAAVYVRTREVLAEGLRRGIARGELRDLPVESVAAALTAGLEGLLLQGMVDPDFDVRAHFDTLWEVMCRGIAR